jgi:hypothetical protein
MQEFKVLSGHNFASISDYIFATYEINKSIFYPLNVNVLENNDIIYCKTDHIFDLFEKIKYLDSSLKLITSESDYPITQNLFSNKPKCIKKWFAINVSYEHEDLVPIPLGISNSNCTITLKFSNIEANKKDDRKLLYMNHRAQTNPEERKWLYDYFSTNDWLTAKQPNLSLEEFKKDLTNHIFMLCPRGNGIDTHRMWESLYAGVYPVVQRHIAHKNLDDLPILFVDDFKQINKKFLLDSLALLKEKKLDKLNIYWWQKFIKESTL